MENVENKHANLGKAITCSVGFFLLFCAFNSAANLSAKMLKEDGLGSLGFVNLAVLYCIFGLTSFFSAPIVNKVGTRFSLVLGGFCYFFWVLCFLCPAYYHKYKDDEPSIFLLNVNFIWFIEIFAAAVNGFGAGILWVAQGKYIADCANSSNKGLYFGFFWAIFMMSQVVGNLVGAFVLGISSDAQVIYYIVMSVVSFCSLILFAVLPKPVQTEKAR